MRGAWIPIAMLPVLLIAGLWLEELSFRAILLFVFVGIVLWVVSAALGMFVVFTVGSALLDVVLVLMIFKGDIRIRG